MKKNMKKLVRLIYASLLACGVMSVNSCAFFELDNYEAPDETLRVKVVDQNGAPVLTDQGSEGIRVRLMDLEWEAMGHEVTPQDYNCKLDGTFQNTKLFPGRYNVTVDGPFVPIVIEDEQGVPVVDGSQDINIKKGEPCEVEFQVQPFLNVEFVDYPQVSDGIITARVRVTRAISRAELNSTLGVTGSWEDANANVTDIQFFVSYSSTVGYRARDEYWSGKIEFSGNAFDAQEGDIIEITSNTANPIPSGRHLFVRAAARINYQTANVQRYNYSDIVEVVIP